MLVMPPPEAIFSVNSPSTLAATSPIPVVHAIPEPILEFILVPAVLLILIMSPSDWRTLDPPSPLHFFGFNS